MTNAQIEEFFREMGFQTVGEEEEEDPELPAPKSRVGRRKK